MSRTIRRSLAATILLLSVTCLHAQDYTYVKGGHSSTVSHTAYTVCYNTSTLCPEYVSWELTRDHLLSEITSRTDEFTPDPDIPQTPPTQAYSRSGYDRGHMAPAADFKWSQKAMQESFYTSNVCPQNNALNAGHWLVLEKACRRWAKQCGTVWVACGPLFFPNQRTMTICRNGYEIMVPDAFFKVALKKEKGHFFALGWVMRNETPEDIPDEEVTKAYSVSVDDIERMTGLDFFSELPDDTETAVESSNDTAHWK